MLLLRKLILLGVLAVLSLAALLPGVGARRAGAVPARVAGYIDNVDADEGNFVSSRRWVREWETLSPRSLATRSIVDETRAARRRAGGERASGLPRLADPAAATTDLLRGASLGPAHNGDSPSQVRARVDDFRRRLEDLGARYMVLVQLDGTPVIYRFRCEMQLVNDAPYGRLFEAEASEAVDAVARVLEEVEDWRRRSSFSDNGSAGRARRLWNESAGGT